jgi:hypothetical protein
MHPAPQGVLKTMTEVDKKPPVANVHGVDCARCGRPIPMYAGSVNVESKGSMGATCPHRGAKHTYSLSDLKQITAS